MQSSNTPSTDRLSWQFSSLAPAHTTALEEFVVQTLIEFGWTEETGIANVLLYGIVRDVAERYSRSNHYHNFRHAVDVFQATAYFVKAIQDRAIEDIPTQYRSSTLRPLDAVAVLTAALFHDAGHFGLGNTEMRNHPLALVYGPQSINEKYHAAQAYAVLSKWTDHVEFLGLVMQLILATDPVQEEPHKADPLLLPKRILRAADVSNAARPYEIAEQWRQLYNQEVGDCTLSSTRQATFARAKTFPALDYLRHYHPAEFEPILRQVQGNIGVWSKPL